METAKLIVTRASERDLKIRGIELLLDGRAIADLSFGGRCELDLEPGPHRLVATNKLKTAAVEFEAGPGETVRFETVGIALGGLWAVMTMLGTVAYRITLERVEQAY